MIRLNREDAEQIEREAGLAPGVIACDREMTQAEMIYLSVPSLPLLALHVDFLAQSPVLVIYEQDIGTSTRSYLQGATHANEEAALDDVTRQWCGLMISRQQGMAPTMGEDLAVSFTGWVPGEPGRRWSWSVEPTKVRNIFSSASRWILLLPELADVPPLDPGGRSPGKCIKSVCVKQVITRG